MQIATSIALGTVLLAGQALAQATFPTEFPAGAKVLTSEEIKSTLSGKTFTVSPADGTTWRLEFKDSGYVFLDTSRGYRDSGKWRIESNQWCTDLQKTGTACTELRLNGEILYYKRAANGEVVPMVLR
jgi:hypothetical protein